MGRGQTALVLNHSVRMRAKSENDRRYLRTRSALTVISTKAEYLSNWKRRSACTAGTQVDNQASEWYGTIPSEQTTPKLLAWRGKIIVKIHGKLYVKRPHHFPV